MNNKLVPKNLPKQLQTKAKDQFDITKFTFLRDLLLVKAVRPKSSNGLVNPEQYEDKPEFGEVIRAGLGVKDMKVGDIIRFGKYSTEAIRTNGEDYFIVHEEDVSAVL